MNYIVEANLAIIFIYVAYVLFLRRENDFALQRKWLLTCIACAMLCPLIEIPTGTIASVALTTITLPELVVGEGYTDTIDVVLIVYLLIAFFVAIPIFLHALKLYRVSKYEAGYYRDDYYVIESNDDRPSWSFFKLIFIGRASELSEEDKDLVLKHEMLHGRLLHSIDMLTITLICIVFWFNPIVWFYRQTMSKIHEFEVDSIIAKQNGAENYSMLLAKTALSRNGFLLTHPFNQSFILKRINMINMIKTRISSLKLGGLAAVVITYFAVIACTEPMAQEVVERRVSNQIDKSGEVFTIVEQSAMPRDGISEFYKELSNALEYPEQARNMGVEGRVFVEFIVNKRGELSDFKVLKGIGAGCDAAAMKALAEMTNWIPGTVKGQAVRQKMVIPITFKLE
jgi:TonB family protein